MSSGYQRCEHRFLRIVLGAFVLLSCLRAWVDGPPLVERAQAQVIDARLQRKQMLGECKRANQILSEIRQILSSGTLNVRVQGADNTSADN